MAPSLSPLFTWRSAIASKESGLSPTQRHVALTLSLHMSEKGESCFPGIPRLADETGLDRRTVQRALSALGQAGWLWRKIGGGPGGTNLYGSTIPEPEGGRHSAAGGGTLPRGGAAQRRPRTTREDVGLPDGSPPKQEIDPIYRALCEAIYGDPSPALTAAEKRRVALAAREILRAGGTPSEVALRARRYRQHPTYKEMALTAQALKSHWGELADSATGKTRDPGCPECGLAGGRHAADCSNAPPPPPPDADRDHALAMARGLAGRMPSD